MTPDLLHAHQAARLLVAAYRVQHADDIVPHGFHSWAGGHGAEAGTAPQPDGGRWLVIRGTESCTDWWRDVDFWRTPAPGGFPGTLHRGFDVHSRRLLQQVRSLVHDATYLDIGAHSLGSAVLPSMLVVLKRWGVPVRRVYAYGMPRTCDQEYAEAFDGWLEASGIETWRIVAVHRGRQDLVTRVPMSGDGSAPWHGWYHVFHPLILEDGNVCTTPEDWEKVRAQREVRWWDQLRLVTRGLRATRAHSMVTYKRALEQAIHGLAPEKGD